MAQQLVDLGEPVSDSTLTLNLIRGLNERFRDAGRHIRRDNPFLKFKDAVDELILEELTMAHQPPARPTALLAAGKGAPSGAPPPSSSGARPHTPPPNSPLTMGAPTPGASIPAQVQGLLPTGRQVSLRRDTAVLQERAVRGRQAGLRAQHRQCWWLQLAVLPPPVGRGHPVAAWPATHDTAPRSPDAATAASSAVGPAAQVQALLAQQTQAHRSPRPRHCSRRRLHRDRWRTFPRRPASSPQPSRRSVLTTKIGSRPV